MKIVKIEEISSPGLYRTYRISYVPNWLEKLLGYKSKEKLYKETGEYYVFRGWNVYINEEGNELAVPEIDKWRNQQKFK